MITNELLWMILSIENEEDRRFAEMLYEKYYSLIRNTIYGILKKNDDELKELVQDVLVKLIENISLLNSFNTPVLNSYIYVTSKNIALNYIKRRNKKASLTYFGEDDDIRDSIVDNSRTPENLFIIGENQKNIKKVLDQLPEKYKLFLQFKYFDEKSDKEIAKIFDIAPDSVKVYVSRARKMAYQIFKEGGIEYDEPE